LGRKCTSDVFNHPLRHSLIAMQHPFLVPGGRFRELYYWDTYWVIKGLLTSGMLSTATGMVSNLVDLVHRFGFVPNANRRYYLNRSQPPYLTQMVELIYDRLLYPEPSNDWHRARFIRHSSNATDRTSIGDLPRLD
jgi:alpha,alpha-trehalase